MVFNNLPNPSNAKYSHWMGMITESAAVNALGDSLQIGTITSGGTTYLTTKARAEQLTGIFNPMSAIRAQAMNSGGGKIQ